tara:strand:- start:7611 stop:8420 length:810 start_codon:yes stop_codon:yes gene_type:complete
MTRLALVGLLSFFLSGCLVGKAVLDVGVRTALGPFASQPEHHLPIMQFKPSDDIEKNKFSVQEDSKKKIVDILSVADGVHFNTVPEVFFVMYPELAEYRGLRKFDFQFFFKLKNYFQDRPTKFKQHEKWNVPNIIFSEKHVDIRVYFVCPSPFEVTDSITLEKCDKTGLLDKAVRDIEKSHVEAGNFTNYFTLADEKWGHFFTGMIRVEFDQIKIVTVYEANGYDNYSYYINDENTGLTILTFGFPGAAAAKSADLFEPISNLRYLNSN